MLAFALVGCTAGSQGTNGSSTNSTSNSDGTGTQPADNGGSAAKKDAQTIAEGESLQIPLSDISTTASFYPIVVNGTAMEVLAVKAPDGSIRTAFNTCEVCYDSGRGYYQQDGDALVCQNCGNRFKTSQVEVESNGCNPWPIFPQDKTVDEDSIDISYDFLLASTKVFANWK
jgi:uncharacterized membrane protein